MTHALIIGGTGQIGRAIAAELLDRSWQVTLAARGGRDRPAALLQRGATLVTLDRETPGALSCANRSTGPRAERQDEIAQVCSP